MNQKEIKEVVTQIVNSPDFISEINKKVDAIINTRFTKEKIADVLTTIFENANPGKQLDEWIKVAIQKAAEALSNNK